MEVTGSAAGLYLELDDAALLAQCDVDTFRARGPGGQKRNKTDSAVRLRHRPTGVMSRGVESRSQHENRARALKRLRQTIALDVRGSVDLETYQPSATLLACVREHRKLAVGRRDARRPSVVAEVLDVVLASQGRVSTAAQHLGVTTGNLSAFVGADGKTKAAVNQLRRAFGLRPLR